MMTKGMELLIAWENVIMKNEIDLPKPLVNEVKATGTEIRMKIYKEQPRGLYLGRYEKGDGHSVPLADATLKLIRYAQSIWDMMKWEKYLEITTIYKKAHMTCEQKISDDTQIDPLLNPSMSHGIVYIRIL